MNILILKLIVGILLVVIAVYDEIIIENLRKEKQEIASTLIYERKKLHEYKKQVEYLNIFKKEIELISKENHYNSCVNLENKLKSAIADLKRLSHFYTKE